MSEIGEIFLDTTVLSCLTEFLADEEGGGGDEEALALLLVFINRVKWSNIKRYSFQCVEYYALSCTDEGSRGGGGGDLKEPARLDIS